MVLVVDTVFALVSGVGAVRALSSHASALTFASRTPDMLRLLLAVSVAAVLVKVLRVSQWCAPVFDSR